MRKSMFFVLPLLLLLINCSNRGGSDQYVPSSPDMSMTKAEAFEEQEAGGTQALAEAPVERKIIKTADYRMQVEDVKASSTRIEALVKQNEGLIMGMNLTNTSYTLENEIIIRVPSTRFDELLGALGKEAVFTDFKRVNAQDVTEEFIDIETRLKTKKEVRDRYIDILRNKARTVEEILKAEEQIRVLQEEIEAREGRLKYLQSQVAMSTINLAIYQRVEYRPQPDTETFADRVRRSLRQGWDLVVDLVIGLIGIWPVLLIVGAIFFFWNIRKRNKSKP